MAAVMKGMRCDMNMIQITLSDQLLIDLLLLGYLQVVRDRHHDHPGLQVLHSSYCR